MKLWHMIVIGIAGAVGVAIVASALPFFALEAGECEYDVIDSAVSPSGEYRALAYHRECGGALSAGGSIEFAVLPAEEKEPSGHGNLGAIRSSRWCPGTRKSSIVSWSSENDVTFTYHRTARADILRDRLRDVSVTYELCEDAI